MPRRRLAITNRVECSRVRVRPAVVRLAAVPAAGMAARHRRPSSAGSLAHAVDHVDADGPDDTIASDAGLTTPPIAVVAGSSEPISTPETTSTTSSPSSTGVRAPTRNVSGRSAARRCRRARAPSSARRCRRSGCRRRASRFPCDRRRDGDREPPAGCPRPRAGGSRRAPRRDRAGRRARPSSFDRIPPAHQVARPRRTKIRTSQPATRAPDTAQRVDSDPDVSCPCDGAGDADQPRVTAQSWLSRPACPRQNQRLRRNM